MFDKLTRGEFRHYKSNQQIRWTLEDDQGGSAILDTADSENEAVLASMEDWQRIDAIWFEYEHTSSDDPKYQTVFGERESPSRVGKKVVTMTLREIRPDDGSPSCHVCGAIMVPTEKGLKCLSCGTTTEPTGPAPSVVESRPQAMKLKVVRCDGSQEVLTLTGPITMIAGEHQNRLATSTGMEHWFTLEGVYDGWGMACNFEIPAEAMPADGLPPDVRSFIDAIDSEREILPKDG